VAKVAVVDMIAVVVAVMVMVMMVIAVVVAVADGAGATEIVYGDDLRERIVVEHALDIGGMA
jgi:hypothetical protein